VIDASSGPRRLHRAAPFVQRLSLREAEGDEATQSFAVRFIASLRSQ
jgi:hypothetical protein